MLVGQDSEEPLHHCDDAPNDKDPVQACEYGLHQEWQVEQVYRLMNLYLIHPAPTRFTRRGRACGWYQISLTKTGCQHLSDLSKQLANHSIKRVYADDQHGRDAHIVAAALGLDDDDVSLAYDLRPFNVGRNHGKPEEVVEPILAKLIEQWKKNPDVPMRGGDSWASYRKRFVAFVLSILRNNVDAVLLTDTRGIRTLRDPRMESLTAASASIRLDRVYVKHGTDKTTAATTS